MTQLISVVRVVVVLTALLSLLSPAHAGAYQPKMQAALDLLEQAKASPEPIPLLEQAKSNLQEAAHNKGGRRLDAIEAIDKAIEVAKSGADPTGKISHAITMVKSGISRGKS